MNTLLINGLLLGLAANFHCIGMCGPIAMAVPVNRKSNLHIFSGVLMYNLGRITTYFILGMIVGSLGLTINTIGVLQWLSIFAGVVLIIYAWRKYFSKLLPSGFELPFIQRFVSKSMGKLLKSTSPFRLVSLGMINGILPCGMVFAGLLNAALTGEVVMSGLSMLAFGIGTLPAMMAVAFAANRISGTVRTRINRVVPYLLTVVGLLIILRGMNLDIPYLSPKIQVVQDDTSDPNAGNLEMSCCHHGGDCE